MSVILMGCSKSPSDPVSAPPPAVGVYQVQEQPVGTYREFVGRSEAHRTVSLKARVEGELIERGFVEGALVREGQLLFAIDDAPYAAALLSAQAELERAESEVERTQGEYERGKQLAPDGYLSQQDLDQLKAAASQAKSALKAAQSALTSAQINLDYTRITAPFSGVIGKTRYNVGTIVGPASEPLAELSDSDPIYVNFQLEESAYISYLQQRQREGKADQAPPIDIGLRLPNNEKYAESGTLNFADTRIDAAMGAVNLRAEFPNTLGVIVPGLYVTLIVEGHQKENKAIIPQSAVQSGQDGYAVLVVNGEQRVEQRLVKLGRRIGPLWVVESGLQAGDQIVVDGLQKVRAGITINPILQQVDPVTGAMSPLDAE
ncbi:efflux RND transporter periplasmic adaptor subunit [Gilvimarinus sp. SDUM040013]|uniref:Efflux RND transporter periplasmic adaptor subunit n=1 Tax=Gilvimarinus gilvus TaxID=3058038 RepID=A0ABU4RU86_9GAMM|nr:efflux RND transporter periplasmic adaptor subunit [Gilvimarinus sp. SDUM040013]MDO3388201.1 efflux RND transporter periplasmic adaptor subunit [Gilvimarinus sp. SDUM040013]MDX6847751.1 efflux RND transporter periplasmic adaptor subunit [Gilvimarinus sp. SDUM040013]